MQSLRATRLQSFDESLLRITAAVATTGRARCCRGGCETWPLPGTACASGSACMFIVRLRRVREVLDVLEGSSRFCAFKACADLHFCQDDLCQNDVRRISAELWLSSWVTRQNEARGDIDCTQEMVSNVLQQFAGRCRLRLEPLCCRCSLLKSVRFLEFSGTVTWEEWEHEPEPEPEP